MRTSETWKLLALCMSFTLLPRAAAQDTDVDLEALKAPSMPAATIIGTQLNEVTRVRSMKALETAILNNFVDANTGLKIPDNYALEFQPFLLGRLKNFDYMEYLGDDQDLGETMWRNLAISVASTKNYFIKDSVATDALGFGIRTVLVQGELSQEIRKTFTAAVNANKLNIRIKSGVRGSIRNTVETVPGATLVQVRDAAVVDVLGLPQFAGLDADAKKFVTDAITMVFDALPAGLANTAYAAEFAALYDEKILDAVLATLKTAIDDVGTERYGWSIGFNGAAALHFPTNDLGYSYGPRYGAWVNVGYRFKKGEEGQETTTASELIFLARVINHNSDFYRRFDPPDTTFDRGLNLDFGLKYALNKDRWSAELEWIYRFNRARESRVIDDVEYFRNVDNGSSKFMLNLNYTVSKNINLSYNIGKDFDDVFNGAGNLISLLNLNVSFGGLDARSVLNAKKAAADD